MCWQFIYKTVRYYLLGLILLGIQALGLEYINTNTANGYLQTLGFSSPIMRLIVYLFILFIPNVLLFMNLLKFVSHHQIEIVKVINEFLKMAIKENLYQWFYTVQFTLGILTGKEKMFLLATPQQYMKMHTAASILARRHYYSFYKAPDIIWKILRDHGGIEYCKEVENISLVSGERYVRQEEVNSNMVAFEDFNNTNGNLIKKYVDPNMVENIPDFSSFDVGNKFVSLKVFDDDEKILEKVISKLTDNSSSHPEKTRRLLNKTKFRVHIELTDNSLPEWVQTALNYLKNNCVIEESP